MLNKRILLFLILALIERSYAQDSQCFGIPANGYLVNGVQLPVKGKNFTNYNQFGVFLGRTYVHSEIAKIVIETYNKLAISNPKTIYKYGETGFLKGGEFKPHKTHQNGLSVDFMVPVVDKKGKSTYFPTTVSNKFGYDVEFDLEGKFASYFIDFEAMAAHIKELNESAKEKGYSIKRVIFDPELQSQLLEIADGNYLRKNIIFSKKLSWVRHDEHYHVDFMIPCLDK